LRKRIDRGEVGITVVDATGQHTYQPGFMYIAMGGERAANLQRPERSLLDKRVKLVVGEIAGVDEAARTVTLKDGLPLAYDQLVLATGSRIVPEAIEHFDTEAHHFYTAEAAATLRAALDKFLQAMAESPAPAVVDLGPVIGSNVDFLGAHLGCKLYLEDLYADLDHPFARADGGGLEAMLSVKLRQARGSVDGILAWDVFDYLSRGEAEAVAARLTSMLRPGGLMLALFTTEPRHEAAPRRYVIVDADHLRHRPAPGARPGSHRLICWRPGPIFGSWSRCRALRRSRCRW